MSEPRPGPLAGLRVIELAGERSAFAGKLMAGMGADVVLVEPPGGDRSRQYEPFLEDLAGPERSLHFWHYHTGKRGIVLELDEDSDRETLRGLLRDSDIFLESETPGRLAELGLDYSEVSTLNPRLVMVSVTPFGQAGPRNLEEATDLTILAAGGPAWMCGYDDHSLPPVRGGGDQGYLTACHFAVMSTLVALLWRNRSGHGQHVDVNMHAAANVTTEAGSYSWLVANEIVQRQTGRHAAVQPTMPITVRCADGRYVNTTVPPRTGEQMKVAYTWLEELGLVETFEEADVIRGAFDAQRMNVFAAGDDPDVRTRMRAGRLAFNHIAAHLPAYEFFTGAQQRGFQVAIVYSPEEALQDPHFVARGMLVPVEHPELGETFDYPGAPIRFTGTPWTTPTRAPLLGEHTASVLAELARRNNAESKP